MEFLLYWLASALIRLLQTLQLETAARLGRAGGAFAYWVDVRHRRVALKNLQLCFGAEKSPAEIVELARENFRRIGENFACAVRTAAMGPEEIEAVRRFGSGTLRIVDYRVSNLKPGREARFEWMKFGVRIMWMSLE